MELIEKLSQELSLAPPRVRAAVELIDAGNTIPFIARYRKEATGSLDDTQLRDLSDRLQYLRSMEKRREEVLAQIDEQGKLTDELRAKIEAAETLAAIDDLYLPYRPKRRTRATIAKERGLEPLAEFLWTQGPSDPAAEAGKYVDPEKEVPDADAALAGAMDILAERVSDDAELRGKVRRVLYKTGKICSKGAPEKDSVYTLYYDFSEPVNRIAGHRILAIDRGERENFLKVSISADHEQAVGFILSEVLRPKNGPSTYFVENAARDGYERLMLPSLERELRNLLTDRAAKAAMKVFSANLRQLLLQPPVRGKTALGLDPAYRTGCKIAVVDPTGKVLDTTVVYPTPPQNKKEEAERVLAGLIRKHGVEVIAIGNGTATGESEQFVAELISHHPELNVAYLIVSEAGASVYSASKLAAEEFPQYDVSLRSAVSIARRLQDPLAELVKIDPKAIGVGQYQHDMPQKELSEALDGVVEGCVNSVGVDLNTASYSLLCHVAGVNSGVAKSIVHYREENGGFRTRKELMKVPKLGKKAFEQCAGFLRIADGKNILDNTAVHPESYPAATQLLTLCGVSPEDVSGRRAGDLRERAEKLGIPSLCERLGIGEPTLKDMIQELLKPGRDPRDNLPPPVLRQTVLEMKDLKPGMELSGTVRNIVDFGAFVDVGVHQDGLVHISQLSDHYVSHPLDGVKVGQQVRVWVLSVEPAKKRISLTMKRPVGPPDPQPDAAGLPAI